MGWNPEAMTGYGACVGGRNEGGHSRKVQNYVKM